MQSKVATVDDYINQLSGDHKVVVQQLRHLFLEKLPSGFEEVMSYGMIGYVVPHSLYPQGYHCNPKLPLSFISIASQKNFIAIYHMGLYGDKDLYNWFIAEFPKYSKTKLDMGKSCIRFKKVNDIPYALLSLLLQKLTPQQWIALYESALER